MTPQHHTGPPTPGPRPPGRLATQTRRRGDENIQHSTSNIQPRTRTLDVGRSVLNVERSFPLCLRASVALFFPGRPRHRVGGFTLIELMVVLMIMATLSGLVAPSVAAALRSTGLGTTGRKMTDLLNFAYLSAVSRRRPVVVNFDPQRRLCWAAVHAVSLPWLQSENEREMEPLATMQWPEGTQVAVTRAEETSPVRTGSQTGQTIVFKSDGGAEDALIEMTDRHGERLEIEIVGATGEVRLREAVE